MREPQHECSTPLSHGPGAPRRVPIPVMRQRWETLTFLHWDYPVERVQRLLPPGLEVEPWGGRAWVGLVPFHMRVRPPVGPALRGVTTFPETNVRTYVLGPDGTPGVWFFSLDAANLPAVTVARLVYGLPYFFARMRVTCDGPTVSYRSRRSGSGAAGAGHQIVVVPGSRLSSGEVGEFEHYLTTRFTLWNVHGGALMRSPAEHPPWQLQQAEVAVMEQDVIEAAGLPSPQGTPVVHFSEGVEVRIGRPRIKTR
jgi:uncharacterized protein